MMGDAVFAEPFSIAAITDTQWMSMLRPNEFHALTAWIADRQPHDCIWAVIHSGDITQNNKAAEWAVAVAAMDRLPTATMAINIVRGNHDDWGDTGGAGFLAGFGPDSQAGSCNAWYGGASPSGLSSFTRFEAGGRDWIVLNLDNATPSVARIADNRAEQAWCRSVLMNHPGVPTILNTHHWLVRDAAEAKVDSQLPPEAIRRRVDANYVGEGAFRTLVDSFDQVFMVLSGHITSLYHLISTNCAGNAVYQIAHDCNYVPGAWVRLIAFDTEQNQIRHSTVNVLTGQGMTVADIQHPDGSLNLDRVGPLTDITSPFLVHDLDFAKRFPYVWTPDVSGFWSVAECWASGGKLTDSAKVLYFYGRDSYVSANDLTISQQVNQVHFCPAGGVPTLQSMTALQIVGNEATVNVSNGQTARLMAPLNCLVALEIDVGLAAVLETSDDFLGTNVIRKTGLGIWKHQGNLSNGPPIELEVGRLHIEGDAVGGGTIRVHSGATLRLEGSGLDRVIFDGGALSVSASDWPRLAGWPTSHWQGTAVWIEVEPPESGFQDGDRIDLSGFSVPPNLAGWRLPSHVKNFGLDLSQLNSSGMLIVRSRPFLEVVRNWSENRMELCWESAAGWRLQQTENLLDPSGWLDIPGTAAAQGYVPESLPRCVYYRLVCD